MSVEGTRFEILMKEREHRVSEVLDYNKRLDRTVVLYITAAYAAIGLNATGQLKFDALTDQKNVWLVFLFVFLNGCVLLHGLSQSCWAMSICKFIHLNLDRTLLALTGNEIQDPKCAKEQLGTVDALCWDDWRKEIKSVANLTRNVVVFLWVFLVLASSAYSLTLVDFPQFFSGYHCLAYSAIGILILTYGFVCFSAIWLILCVRQYHHL